MYALLKSIALPPASLFVVIAVGLAMRWKYPKGGTIVAWIGGVVFYALSTTFVSHFLLVSVEAPPGPSLEALARSEAGAIVILSAGMQRAQPEYGGETVDRRTLVRLRYGAYVHRATNIPVLVTGGLLANTTTPVAVAMSESLTKDFGIDPRWVEPRSATTAENAQFTREMLAASGVDRIILVTHATHMRRAQAAFENVGFSVVPAPTEFSGDAKIDLSYFIPSVTGVEESHIAIYEALGWLWYRITGDI